MYSYDICIYINDIYIYMYVCVYVHIPLFFFNSQHVSILSLTNRASRLYIDGQEHLKAVLDVSGKGPRSYPTHQVARRVGVAATKAARVIGRKS